MSPLTNLKRSAEKLPALKLLAAAEIALLARDHAKRLSRQERRRLVTLMLLGRGRRRNLTQAERLELARLVAKAEPRLLAGQVIERLSPLPLPRRILYGSRRPF